MVGGVRSGTGYTIVVVVEWGVSCAGRRLGAGVGEVLLHGLLFHLAEEKIQSTHIGTGHEIYLWHSLVVSLVLWRHISHLGKRCPIVHTARQIGQGIPGIRVVSGWRVLAL